MVQLNVGDGVSVEKEVRRRKAYAVVERLPKELTTIDCAVVFKKCDTAHDLFLVTDISEMITFLVVCKRAI